MTKLGSNYANLLIYANACVSGLRLSLSKSKWKHFKDNNHIGGVDYTTANNIEIISHQLSPIPYAMMYQQAHNLHEDFAF